MSCYLDDGINSLENLQLPFFSILAMYNISLTFNYQLAGSLTVPKGLGQASTLTRGFRVPLPSPLTCLHHLTTFVAGLPNLSWHTQHSVSSTFFFPLLATHSPWGTSFSLMTLSFLSWLMWLHINSDDSELYFSSPVSISLNVKILYFKPNPQRKNYVLLKNERKDYSSDSQPPEKFLEWLVCTGKNGSRPHFVGSVYLQKLLK